MYNEGAGKRMTNDKKVICCNRCGSKLLSYNEYSKKHSSLRGQASYIERNYCYENTGFEGYAGPAAR